MQHSQGTPPLGYNSRDPQLDQDVHEHQIGQQWDHQKHQLDQQLQYALDKEQLLQELQGSQPSHQQHQCHEENQHRVGREYVLKQLESRDRTRYFFLY